MKKPIRYLLYAVGILMLLIGGFVVYLQAKGIPTYEPQKIELTVEATPARVLQGKKLAGMLCVHCHYDEKTDRLTGRFSADLPTIFGEIYSQNITQHEFYGIGKWSDGELFYFLRTGVRPDGSYAPPYMPKFGLMSDEDLYSIIAWLRSDDPRLTPSSDEPKASVPSLFAKFLCNIALPKPEYNGILIANPDTNNALEHGRYLATAQLDCYSCHSADFAKLDYKNPEKSMGFMGGGNKMFDMEGNVKYSANITMHKETGIGTWTEEEFVQAVKYGQAKGKALTYPMTPYLSLTDKEVKSIYAYLKMVPEIENKIQQ